MNASQAIQSTHPPMNRIELELEEKAWYDDVKLLHDKYYIVDDPRHAVHNPEEVSMLLVSQAKLYYRLKKRQVIPYSRKRFFIDKDYNFEDSRTQRKTYLEDDGSNFVTKIHFVHYMIYFVEGPMLNEDIIDKAEELFVGTDYNQTETDVFVNFLKPRIESESKETFVREVCKLLTEINVRPSDIRRMRTKLLG